MSDDTRREDEKELKDEELDNVSGGTLRTEQFTTHTTLQTKPTLTTELQKPK